MSKSTKDKIDSPIVQGAINLHKFQPGGTAIWTMVGRDREHWVDVDLGFCSCKRYYYRTLSDGQSCYHLKSVELAIKTQKYTTIDFHDSERKFVIEALISDLKNSLLSPQQSD